jgi:radical SAM superfamily enzyme YgiQ (UPF0313 family)
LKKDAHQVGLLFLCEELGTAFDLLRIQEDICRLNPDVIGISLMETQRKYVEAFCKDVRRYYKGFIVCGGPYPTMAPDEVLSLDAVDAVCVGEGDDALPELVEALEKGRDHLHIRNIWCKGPRGAIIQNRLRPFKDLDELPQEDRELFDIEAIVRLKNGQLEVMLGRGCGYRCAYCINDSYRARYSELCEHPVGVRDYVRFRNAPAVVDGIKKAVSRHPAIRKIAIVDDNFLMDKRYLEGFCRLYKEEVGLPFMCNANPVSFDRAKGVLLKEAGCDDIRFGIESGSERVKNEIMNRRITNQSVRNAFKITQDLGLMTSSFNMIGLPTETKNEIIETLKLNASILPDTIKVMTFYPFKNTPLYGLCENLGLIDYEIKRELDNYDTFTCLKFPAEHRLFLRKVQTAFNWYINSFLNNSASPEYARLINTIETMGEDEWNAFDFYSADKKISNRFKEMGVLHYSKFVNRSLAVKFPSKHLCAEVKYAE